VLPLGGDGGFGSLFNFLALLLGSFGWYVAALLCYEAILSLCVEVIFIPWFISLLILIMTFVLR